VGDAVDSGRGGTVCSGDLAQAHAAAAVFQDMSGGAGVVYNFQFPQDWNTIAQLPHYSPDTCPILL